MAGPVSIAFVSSLPRWGGGEKWMLHAARRAILVRERVAVACVNQDREVHLTAFASA
jgi:hypothetical protein